jgi:hypothetical protein
MIQDTTPIAAPLTPPALLTALWQLLEAHRPAVRQARCFDRLRALVLGQVIAAGRRTIAGVLLALGLCDADGSAFYRLFSVPRLDYDVLTRCFLRQTLSEIPALGPYVTVVDAVQIPRCSITMPGTAWLKNPRTPPFKPGIHRAQRFEHLAALLPCWEGYSRALPLRFVPACPPKAVPGAAEPAKEWEAGRAQLVWLRQELDAAGRTAQRVLAVGDGGYDVGDLWASLPERTVLLARTARNRVLYAVPPAPKKRRRGRPPVYGPRALTPAQWLHERTGWQQTTVRVRGRALALTYRVEGPFLREGAPEQPLFVLVVRGCDRRRGRKRIQRPAAFYLISAVQQPDATAWVLPWSAEELLAWAWQRWEVEVTHRAMKTDCGVGEVQCWHPTATVCAVQAQVWAYAVCVLAGHRAWGYADHPSAVRPPGVWWHGAPRWSLATLWRGVRQALGVRPDFPPGCTGTTGTWAEKEAWVHRLDALLAA